MAEFDLVIKNGKIATSSDVFDADLGIIDGRIAAIASSLDNGKREIDASGKFVLPGGIDAHCHFDQPTGDDSIMADDFLTGTRSAAYGGTTTIIPFALQMQGQSLPDAIKDYHLRADGKCYIDYAFHLIITDPTPQLTGQDLPAAIADGYTSFKIYMTYDSLKLNDRQILDLLATAKKEGAMPMIHAENADCIDWLTSQLEADGKTAPFYHTQARPALVEREATHRAVTLSELVGTPVLIVHVSGKEALEQIRMAQNRGIPIYAETCPQYLFLSGDALDQEGFEGAKCVCSPPPRDEANQKFVWRSLINGTCQIFSSDHAPFKFEDDAGKKVNGEEAPFSKIPNGIPGVETRLPLLFSAGVMEGRMDLTRFVALTSTNPAKLYGLYPQKGSLTVGSDADIVIWDPDKHVQINNEILHHAVDYTPYEGIDVQGWPVTVISRGDVVVDYGELIGKPGRGHFIHRTKPLETLHGLL